MRCLHYGLTLLFIPITHQLQHLTIKILAQRRPDDLHRLLSSLIAGRYPHNITLDLEIYVDNVPSPTPAHVHTLTYARHFAATSWAFGDATVIAAHQYQGLRAQWLRCANPSVFGDEFGRVIIIEDDVELSPAWFEFLDSTIKFTRHEPRLAGISLQRQPYRLDAYANEVLAKRTPNSMAPLFVPDPDDMQDDELYAFAHVGSWAFSPEPWVWFHFVTWFNQLDDHTHQNMWSVASDGSPRADAEASGQPFTESLPSRWYRAMLLGKPRWSAWHLPKHDRSSPAANENSMWTAHFGAFLAQHSLFVVHAKWRDGKTLATSYRSQGEHYALNKADAPLLDMIQHTIFAPERRPLPRIALSGERLPPDALPQYDPVFYYDESRARRNTIKRSALERLDEAAHDSNSSSVRRVLQGGTSNALDVFYVLSGNTATADVPAAVQGLGFGWDPFYTLSHDQALCVLDGKKVAILGDSISRYFTWTFNWFLRYGTLMDEFEGSPTNPDYYDQLTSAWTDGYRSTQARHRQSMISVPSGYFSDVLPYEIETRFWFIQDTWYDDLETLAQQLEDEEYDVLIFNSGWWERASSITDQTGTIIDGVDCSLDAMYADGGACLGAYEADLDALYSGLLASFVADPQKAVIFRTSTCCGGSFTDDLGATQGSIAVSAMNAVVKRVMTEFDIDILDVEHMINSVNINIDRNGNDNDDPRDRSFDGTHPRATQNYVWTHMLINKIAKQLNRVESCGLGVSTEAPTTRPPTTAEPTTSKPTARPSIPPTYSVEPTSARCRNGELDEGESDIDCGGFVCDRCRIGFACQLDTDCITGSCADTVCASRPTSSPTSIPTTNPTALPTPEPTTGRPTTLPTISTPPSKAPVARPTLAPQPPVMGGGSEENCEDSYAGCPPPTPLELCQGQTCFACIDVQDDGVRYRRHNSELSRIFSNNCPSAGQRMLLALLLACITALVVACFATGDGRHCCGTILSCFICTRRNGEADTFLGAGHKRALETGSLRHPSETQAHHGGGAVGRGKLEDELSGSALMVLQQMEAQEEQHRAARADRDKNNAEMTSTRDKTGTLGAIAEDEELPGGVKPSSHLAYYSNGPRQRAGHHSHATAVSSLTRHTGHNSVGSRGAPRTTNTAFSRLTWGSHQHGSAIGRSSKYGEPFADRSQAYFTSSVAFSFYDGGDSDDEDDDAAVPVDQQDMLGAIGGGAKHDKHPAAANPPQNTKTPGKKTWAAATTALELALILIACVIGEHRMPSGFLPAGSRYQAENPDMWTFIMLALCLVSIIKLKIVEPDSSNTDDSIFLSRAQANEWKGWMQVAFVAYHYTNAQDVYVPVRWFVSAYVWLSGFGNGVYFWGTADFSLKRFTQQLWRINFLCLLLSLATATPWIDYYFVALATVHFVLIWLALAIARLISRFVLYLPKPDRKQGHEAVWLEKVLGLSLLVGFVTAIWAQGTPDDFGSGSRVYRTLFQGGLRGISTHTENYFWTRTRMDYLSSVHGLAFAAIYTKLRDTWPTFSMPLRTAIFVPCFSLLAVAIAVAKLPRYCCLQGKEYRRVNAYIGTLWIPAYLVARNYHPWLANRISTPMEWVGMHSLEFYLLQFHVFLTRRSQEVLYIIPNQNWAYTNMAIVGFIYVIIVVKSLEVTNVLRSVAWRASKVKVAISFAWCLLFYIIFATAFSGKGNARCSSVSWLLWAVFTVFAVVCFAIWTATS